MDLLSPSTLASLGHDQCVEPSLGFCCVLRAILACTFASATRGWLPLWRASSPATPASSNLCFQREIVAAVVCSEVLIWLQLSPSAKAKINRARKTSPAGKVRDVAQNSRPLTCIRIQHIQRSRAPASVRVRAADSVLDHSAKAIELEEIEARVAELERAANANDASGRRR